MIKIFTPSKGWILPFMEHSISPHVHYKNYVILPLLLRINVLNFKILGLKLSILDATACNFILHPCVKFPPPLNAVEPLQRYALKSNHLLFMLRCNYVLRKSVYQFLHNTATKFVTHRQIFCKNNEVMFRTSQNV